MFSDRKTLTKLVNKKGWKIYRDSEVGLYALNEEKGIDLNLYVWNVTLNDPALSKHIAMIRSDIEAAEKEYEEGRG